MGCSHTGQNSCSLGRSIYLLFFFLVCWFTPALLSALLTASWCALMLTHVQWSLNHVIGWRHTGHGFLRRGCGGILTPHRCRSRCSSTRTRCDHAPGRATAARGGPPGGGS